MNSWLRPIPFGRLVLVHRQIWRAQRGVVAGCLLALVAGLLSVAAAMATLSGTVTAATVGARFAGFPVLAFTLLWTAAGAIAAAAPFKSGWAAAVLTVAPRRGRWLAACLVSFLLLTVAVTALFAVSAAVLAAVVLVAKGHGLAPVAGVARPMGVLLLMSVVEAGIGFLLGAATRSVTASIIIGYVVAPALPMARIGSADLGRWLDLNGALASLSPAHAVTAVALWAGAPALVAWSRLRSSLT